MKVKPIVKWVGGKSQLLPVLEQNLPESFDTYYEPFLGGGALYFYLLLDKPIVVTEIGINKSEDTQSYLSKMIPFLDEYFDISKYYVYRLASAKDDGFGVMYIKDREIIETDFYKQRKV